MPHDLLGHELTDTEAQLARLYGELKALAGRDDLPPCVTHNVRKALACMWQAVTDLNVEFEQIYDVGA
jgi:hypothetical protein